LHVDPAKYRLELREAGDNEESRRNPEDAEEHQEDVPGVDAEDEGVLRPGAGGRGSIVRGG